MDIAECVSRSCTTGWLDWIHGELWLTPTGLLRRRLSLQETRSHGLGPTVTEPLDRVNLKYLLVEHPTIKVLLFAEVSHARLVQGVTAHGLRLRMRGGQRHKLLWLIRDPAYRILSEALPTALGERLRHAAGHR
jgi:hypothetical protein